MHLVVHWPNGIRAKGEIRSQYHHIADIAPTILDCGQASKMPAVVPRREASSRWTACRCAYSFDNDVQGAQSTKKRQYYEMFGNRAIWVDGWKAVTLHAKTDALGSSTSTLDIRRRT